MHFIIQNRIFVCKTDIAKHIMEDKMGWNLSHECAKAENVVEVTYGLITIHYISGNGNTKYTKW